MCYSMSSGAVPSSCKWKITFHLSRTPEQWVVVGGGGRPTLYRVFKIKMFGVIYHNLVHFTACCFSHKVEKCNEK